MLKDRVEHFSSKIKIKRETLKKNKIMQSNEYLLRN